MHAARLSRSVRLRRVLAVLRDRREHSTLDLIHAAGACAVSAIVSELRANGHRITCRQIVAPHGERIWLYRLEAAA